MVRFVAAYIFTASATASMVTAYLQTPFFPRGAYNNAHSQPSRVFLPRPALSATANDYILGDFSQLLSTTAQTTTATKSIPVTPTPSDTAVASELSEPIQQLTNSASEIQSGLHLPQFLVADAFTDQLSKPFHQLSESATGMQDMVQGGLQLFGDLQLMAIALTGVCFFWGIGEGRGGLEEGKKMNEERIKKIETELNAVYSEAENKEAEEVADLRQKMNDLQAQIDALTTVAENAAQELAETQALLESQQTVEKPVPIEEPEVVPEPVAEKVPEPVPGQVAEEIPEPEPELAPESVAEEVPEPELAPEPTTEEVLEPELAPDVVAQKDEPEKPAEEVEAVKTRSPKVKGAKKSAASQASPKKKKTKTTKKKKKAPKKKTVEITVVNGEAEPSTAAKKSSPRVETTAKNGKASEDWGVYSVSTLKRKTIKDLVAYLNDNGVECTGENGKPLKKDELVGLVRSK